MPRPHPDELPEAMDLAAREAAAYLKDIADRPVRDPRAEEVAATFGGPLPSEGVGAVSALQACGWCAEVRFISRSPSRPEQNLAWRTIYPLHMD